MKATSTTRHDPVRPITDATGRHAPVVYYLTNQGALDVVKIGTTVNMTLRFRRFAKTMPNFVPTLLAWHYGDEYDEGRLHQRFRDDRLMGEWFWTRGAVADHLRTLGASLWSVESMAHVLNHSTATGTAKVVLLGIANHDGDGGAWPTIATLARYANVHPRNVKRAIQSLVDLGEVRVIPQGGGTLDWRDDKRPNRYVITVPKRGDAGATPSDGVTLASSRGDAGVIDGVTLASSRGDAGVTQTVQEPPKEPSSNHPPRDERADVADDGALLAPAEAVAPDPFEEFWAAYPTVRGTKTDARKAWKSAVQRAGSAAVVIAGAERYRDDPNRVDEFTKGAGPWLRGSYWTAPPLPARGGSRPTTSERMAAAARVGVDEGSADPWAALAITATREGHR